MPDALTEESNARVISRQPKEYATLAFGSKGLVQCLANGAKIAVVL